MRLFLAIQLSPAVREALLTAQDALRRQGRGSFPPPENLHLTLAFLGEAEDPARARAALSEVSCRPFSLAVGGPPGHFGDLWWAGVRADPALEELAVSLQADLRSQGFCQEDRPWLPHITLVRRWRGEAPQVTVPHASMVVRQISLLRSDQIDGKRIFTDIKGAVEYRLFAKGVDQFAHGSRILCGHAAMFIQKAEGNAVCAFLKQDARIVHHDLYICLIITEARGARTHHADDLQAGLLFGPAQRGNARGEPAYAQRTVQLRSLCPAAVCRQAVLIASGTDFYDSLHVLSPIPADGRSARPHPPV